jgi:NAD+ kinase
LKKIGILYHPLKPEAVKLAAELGDFIKQKGTEIWSFSAWEFESARATIDGTELVLTIGGDGTILRAAQVVIPGKIPITGINLGNLGFMTELNVPESRDAILRLMNGEGWIDERSVLEATYSISDKQHTHHALNDVVIARGMVVRTILVEAIIDDQSLTTYKADGVIVATATGSTGYNLAAGGPILHPRTREIVMVPIMPHLSPNYPIVLPTDSTIELRVVTLHPATMSIDGHTNLSIESGFTVFIKRSQDTVRFLRIHEENGFYSSLEKRLKGKQ